LSDGFGARFVRNLDPINPKYGFWRPKAAFGDKTRHIEYERNPKEQDAYEDYKHVKRNGMVEFKRGWS
jgi:hypothetical protein